MLLLRRDVITPTLPPIFYAPTTPRYFTPLDSAAYTDTNNTRCADIDSYDYYYYYMLRHITRERAQRSLRVRCASHAKRSGVSRHATEARAAYASR